MKKTLAFVLSGGGSRGALQVGALFALLEHGFQPDMLVGTSIGAVNATFLALHGFSRESLDDLKAAWLQAAELDLLPLNYFMVSMRRVLGRTSADPAKRIRDFIISHGVTPELKFGEITSPRLVIVSTDLNTGQPVLFGDDPEEKVLDGLLISTALPPWVMPVRKQSRYLMDGGIVSNLPIEPALRTGAERIIALDIMSEYKIPETGLPGLLGKITMAVEKRQISLEMELAEARGVPTFYLALADHLNVPFWDFRHSEELIEQGYRIASQELAEKPGRLAKF